MAVKKGTSLSEVLPVVARLGEQEESKALYEKAKHAYDNNGTDTLEYISAALLAAEKVGPKDVLAFTLLLRAQYYSTMEQPELARPDLEMLEQLIEAIDTMDISRNRALTLRGNYHYEMGHGAWYRNELAEARLQYLESIRFAQLRDDNFGQMAQVAAYACLGNVMEAMGDLQGTIDYFAEALRVLSHPEMMRFLANDSVSNDQYAQLLCLLAETCVSAGDYESAHSYIEGSLAARPIDFRTLAEIHRISSTLLIHKEDIAAALEAARQALEFASRTGIAGIIRSAAKAQANALMRSCNFDAAIDALQKMLSASINGQDGQCEAYALLSLCYANLTSTDDDAAEISAHGHLTRAEQLLPEVNEFEVPNCYLAISEAKSLLGDAQGAYEALRLAHKKRAEVYTPKIRNEIGSMRLLMRVEREEHQKEIEQIKREQFEKELAGTTVHLAMQTELLATFRNDLRHIVHHIDEPITALKKIKEKLKTLPCEQIDWMKFEKQFIEVHPEFKAKLIEKYPDLTRQEVKMCQFARLGLKNIEIAQLLCLSERSVESHRFNLRKKLGLKTEQNLSQFLSSLK